MPTVYIDNKPFEVKAGKNLLETCLGLGFDLPYFCWHPALGSIGACRQCAVKIFKDEEDKKGRIIMSCMEPVTDNQRISVIDPEATAFRSNVIEGLMTNHPHDCAVCDEGGSCHLQDMTVMSGHSYRRYQYNKRTYRNQNLGPFLNHEMNRCIQCYRCVRYYKDYAGGKDLDAFASRNQVYFGRAEDGTLESEFSGNLAEVCPTGVFTDKTLKEHYTRKWDLTMAPSVCQHCSLGCNTVAGERYGQLRMIGNRYNGEVNGYFLCDRGRFGYEFTNSEDRIRTAFIEKKPVLKAQALNEVARAIKKGKAIGIGSPRASLQSNFALKTLVGEDHFYHGVSDAEHSISELIIGILKDGPTRTYSLREVERADAVFILGEDVINTAPMLGLAVRQSVRQQPLKEASKHVPAWHDAAARELTQDKKGPLFIATLTETKLDDIATETFHAAPDEMARVGFAVANLIDPTIPPVTKLSSNAQALASRIAQALLAAERPVIISGSSCQSPSLIKAAANIAWALQRRNANTGIVMTLPECNSMGLAMMGGHRLNSAFDAVLNGHADTVIIMENDLYRHGDQKTVDEFLKKAKQVIVFDHIVQPTVEHAHIVLSAGTFAESDGTIVNNEGRAQRYFQVYECDGEIQESWRWILQIAQLSDNAVITSWRNFEDVTNAITKAEPLLKNISQASPSPAFRISGQKIPREPHRYSGRTAILANVNVSESKPPVDPDSPLSYTMEGYKGVPPSSVIPFFWSPGWNSIQSVNKYQEEIGASLKGGDPGIHLLAPHLNGRAPYFMQVPESFSPMKDHLWTVPIYHIFGSEELSVRGKAIASRVPKKYLLINDLDAKEQKFADGEEIQFDIEGQLYRLPVRLDSAIPKGVAGLPYGLPGISFVELPGWLIFKR
jgi:NADH-quinone oxidoreductase subunit G